MRKEIITGLLIGLALTMIVSPVYGQYVDQETKEEKEERIKEKIERYTNTWKILLPELEKQLKQTPIVENPEIFLEWILRPNLESFGGTRQEVLLSLVPSEQEAPEGTILTKEFLKEALDIHTEKMIGESVHKQLFGN